MNPASEIEVWTGEVIAVAIAEDAELESGKQSDFHGAGQVNGCAGDVVRAALVVASPAVDARVAVTVRLKGMRVATMPWSEPEPTISQMPQGSEVGARRPRIRVGLPAR